MVKGDVQAFPHGPNSIWRLRKVLLSKGFRHILFQKCKSTINAIQSHTGKQHNIIWITIFYLHFDKTLHSMSLFSAVRPSFNINLDREERPERHLSPRSKIMSKLVATRKFCPVEKSYVFFLSAGWISLISESRFRNLLLCFPPLLGKRVTRWCSGTNSRRDFL